MCAQQGEELPDCDATVAELLACAEEYGNFWASRTCDMDALTDTGPACDDELASLCPSLYGSDDDDEDDDDVDGGTSDPETGSCDGLADSCVLQSSSQTCTALDGCQWLSASDTCSGSARACTSYTSESTCTDQDGCTWTE